MTEGFITWDTLQVYGSFVSVVYIMVKFTKELRLLKPIPTKYYTWCVSFAMIVLVNIQNGSFKFSNWYDIVLYGLSAILISMSGNGIADFNKRIEK